MKREASLAAAVGLFVLVFAQGAKASWGSVQRLTWTSGDSMSPVIAIGSNNVVHVVWHDNTAGNFEIYYKRSTNGGATWSANQRLTWTSGSSTRPAIAIDSYNVIHVVWEDNTPGGTEVYYKASPDGGTTWSAAKRLTWTPGESIFPAIGIGPGNAVHVIWQDPAPVYDEIYYRRSTDEGVSWGAVQRLTWNSGMSVYPEIAVSPGYLVQVVWTDYTPGNAEIYFKGSSNGGNSWNAAQRLTWNSGFSFTPVAAIDSSGTSHVLWSDSTPGNDVLYYRKRGSGGATWSAVQRLTWTSGNAFWPRLVIDSSDTLHIVWYDITSGNYEVYYRRSADGGTTWGAAQRLTWTASDSYDPAIAADSNKALHVVWYDDAVGNYEIYYKKGT
jgi:hypothetical protein